MFRGMLRRLFDRAGSDADDDGAQEGTRFVPSVLDRSVRYAHGGTTTEVERELAEIEEEARKLEDQGRQE